MCIMWVFFIKTKNKQLANVYNQVLSVPIGPIKRVYPPLVVGGRSTSSLPLCHSAFYSSDPGVSPLTNVVYSLYYLLHMLLFFL